MDYCSNNIYNTFNCFFTRPYNNVEFNAATIYCQSYSRLCRNVVKYIEILENYSDTEDKIYLENALIRLENIIDSLDFFRLTHQIGFRNTLINEKVIKADVFSLKVFQELVNNYISSQDIIRHYIEGKELINSTFQDFLNYNQLILDSLIPNEVGYDSGKKEFKIVLADSKRDMLEEGLNGLRQIVIEVRYAN